MMARLPDFIYTQEIPLSQTMEIGMSASHLYVQPSGAKRKGLAIASLILGIVSISTLGLWVMGELGALCRRIDTITTSTFALWVIGAFTGIVLGNFVVTMIKIDPNTYGGKWLAKTGIFTNGISLAFIVIGPVIMFPELTQTCKLGREAAVISSLRTIHVCQEQFNATNARFAALKELAESGLIDRPYADRTAISGYVYSFSDVSKDTYCVQAKRVCGTSGPRDFAVCEDGTIRFVESKTPTTVRRGAGEPIGGAR
jgi:hypothetical protein